MIYCPKCGIKVKKDVPSCPLCDFSLASIPGLWPATWDIEKTTNTENPNFKSEASNAVEHQLYPEKENSPQQTYQRMTTKEKQKLGMLITGLIFVLPVTITLIVDLATNRRLTWSQYVFVPLAFITVSLFSFFAQPRRPIIGVTVSLVSAFLLTYITSGLATQTWVWETEYSVFMYSMVVAELLALYLIYARRGWVSVVNSSLLATAVYLVGLEYILTGFPLGWSLIVGLSLALPFGTLGYAAQAKKKGLNLIGWVFFEITLYLLSLDLLLSGTLTWSLIPMATCLPVSLCAYLLHGFWFKDTDWKKSLHL